MQAMLIKWAVIALMMVAAAVAGYMHGVGFEQGRQAQERVEEQARWMQDAIAVAERGRKWNAKVADALDNERRARADDKADFERRLRNAPRGTLIEASCPSQPARNPTDSVPVADASATGSAGGADRLSDGGVRFWNEALAAAATQAERAGWLASANADAGPADIRRALGNLRANAGLLGECREREQLMRAWLCSEGLAECGAP